MTQSSKDIIPPQDRDPSIWNPNADVIRNVDLELIFYGHEACKPGKHFGPDKKGHYKIHYVHSGKGIIQNEGRTFHVHAGQCFVFYPDDIVYYEADTVDPWTYSWVAFDGANAEYYLKRANISEGMILVESCNEQELRQAFDELMQVDLADLTKDLKYISLLYRVLASLQVDTQMSSVLRQMRYPSVYVKTAIRFIHENYDKDISVVEVANHLSLERKYFSRIFKENLGVTPNAYILNYRMIKACELLDNPELPIAEVAARIGYESPFSFSRAFKNCKGLSPTEYREAQSSRKAGDA